VLGQLELSVEAPSAAITWLHPLVESFHKGGFVEPGLYPFQPDLIEAYAAVGRIQEAVDLLDWLRQAAGQMDHPWARVTSGRAAAMLHMARRDPHAAVAAAAQAVTEARELEFPLELGRCLLILGTGQRRVRRRRDAARTLDEATTIFDELGAPCWAALARRQRAHLAHSSEQLLTPAEQRVAELAVQGLTNAEIAAQMQISLKTVEANLTRIYRKLGVRSRIDLARHIST
jgi:DNA-binding CsgD family transcriptional regulator